MSHLYPVGIQSFEKIRKEGYCYIDKTAFIHSLVKSGQYYFLSRPRRFGKSLLISTLEAYFFGKKELFNGLALEELEKDWITYPVLHLDLNTQKYNTPEALTNVLEENLKNWEDLYGASDREIGVARRFNGVIRRAAEKTGRNVVILVDEYDKPMLQAIGNEELLSEYRSTLKAFYGVLKSCDPYIRFALLTGVTKFSKVSVFSDLNNLMDISMSNRFANICGITEQELHTEFKEDILTLAQKNNATEDEVKQLLKEQYDGYHFVEDSEDIYNPFSLLNTFAEMKFGSYWFETGTPTFLVELLKRSKYNLYRLTEEIATADSLGGIDSMDSNPVPFLYQSGYLTIKKYDPLSNGYYLGIPNKEVRAGLMENLLPIYSGKSDSQSLGFAALFYRDLLTGNIDQAMEQMKAYFASIPYPEGGKSVLENMQKNEYYYETILYIVLSMMNVATYTQVKSCRGRADAVMFAPTAIFVFEIKINKPAQEALAQINEKGYMIPYSADERKIYKIGISFSTQTRTVEDWEFEEVK